ncbi:MAG: N-acetylmuramoyl-L-alanine amidase [Acidobacteria bacterium]|nr:N-acetylmuramoyl-L-alanine amidase [Acidobacteriota bacterium]
MSKIQALGSGCGCVAAIFLCSVLVARQEARPSSPTSGQQTGARIERLVLIDPAHGGSDTGAMLNPAIPEKDVNLAFARRLRQELSNHGLPAQLLRDEDTTLTADQRAARVNSEHPTLYITIHSTSLGSGITVINALLPAVASTHGLFLPWQTAQSTWLAQSRLVSTLVTPTIERWGLPARLLLAPLRPLNNVTAPAFAIEIAPMNGDILQLASVEYQRLISTAMANAVVGTLGLLPARPGPIS